MFVKKKFFSIIVILLIILVAGIPNIVLAEDFEVNVIKDLNFTIEKPVKGRFKEDEAGKVEISATIPKDTSARISFEAKPLLLDIDDSNWDSYWDNKNNGLDVKYNIIDINGHFTSRTLKPGKIIYFTSNQSFKTTFKIRGEVHIESLTDQPAGTYRGKIIVTVSGE